MSSQFVLVLGRCVSLSNCVRLVLLAFLFSMGMCWGPEERVEREGGSGCQLPVWVLAVWIRTLQVTGVHCIKELNKDVLYMYAFTNCIWVLTAVISVGKSRFFWPAVEQDERDVCVFVWYILVYGVCICLFLFSFCPSLLLHLPFSSCGHQHEGHIFVVIFACHCLQSIPNGSEQSVYPTCGPGERLQHSADPQHGLLHQYSSVSCESCICTGKAPTLTPDIQLINQVFSTQ